MYRIFILSLSLLLGQILLAQPNQKFGNDIGDTIHAVHYNIHLSDINTDEQSISAYSEIRVIPLVNDLTYIPLELKDLSVDSIFVDGSLDNFSHTDDIIRIPIAWPVLRSDTLIVGVYYHGEEYYSHHTVIFPHFLSGSYSLTDFFGE